jgi:hypothetical protein
MMTVLMAMPTSSSLLRGPCQTRTSAIPTPATTTVTAALLRRRLAQVCGNRPKVRVQAVPVPSSAMRTSMSTQATAM